MNTTPEAMAPTDDIAIDDALDAAESADAKLTQAIRAQVTQWVQEYNEAREFDKEIRKQYAKGRRYARGDSGFEVSVNIIGSNIDTMASFVYARNPDVSAIPSPMVEAPKDPMPQPPQPPPGLQAIMANPAQALAAASEQGIEAAAFQIGADLAAEKARFEEEQQAYQVALAEWHAVQAAKRQRKLELALFAQTIEVVVSKLWKKGKLKRQARRTLRAAFTKGVGWLKLSWQERTQRDPVVHQQLNDLQDNLRRIARDIQALEDPACLPDLEAHKLAIEQQMRGLEEKVERVVARGMAIDVVRPDDLQVETGTDIMQYLDAPWLAERIYYTIRDASVRWPDVPIEKLRSATRFHRKAPKCEHVAPEAEIAEDDEEQFVMGEGNGPKSDRDYICVVEKWSLDDGLVYRTALGLDLWLDEPLPPNVMSPRFYPYFPLAFIEVDDERAPQSLVERSWSLQNEYNRTRSAGAEMRRRGYPAVLFDESEVAPSEIEKVRKAARQEYVGVKLTTARNINEVFAPKPVSSIDPAMVDTAPVLRDMDRIWGIQEALTGSIEASKTATEAEIQQGGFQSRTGSMRDLLEDWLGEIAAYTATIAVQKLAADDVLQLAGPDAVWPELDTPEELESLIDVDIRAGSSGKPNSRAEREAWQTVMPMVAEAIERVGALRGSSPSEIADRHEALIEETFMRAGDSADITRFLPQSEGTQGPTPPPPPGGAPVAPPLPSPQDPAPAAAAAPME